MIEAATHASVHEPPSGLITMPTWLSPIWLWLLLLVPVYFILHLLIHSAAQRNFASLLLWKRLRKRIEQKQRSIPSLKYVITSLLLSLLLTAVIVSVAGPVFRAKPGEQETLHLLVDLSASMAVQNAEGTSRYRRAIRRLERLADRPTTPSRWTVTLLTRPDRTHEGSADEMITLLAEQSVTDLSFERSLKTTAETLLEERTSPLVLVTDDRHLDDGLFNQRKHRMIVGSNQPNTGIVSLRAQINQSTLTLTIQVAHHGTEEQKAHLEAKNLDGSVQASREVILTPGEKTTTFLSVKGWTGSSGALRLHPGETDALSSDDVVHFTSRTAYLVRTKLQGTNQHVVNLLSSLSTVRPVDQQPDVTFFYRPSREVTNSVWENPSTQAIVVDPPPSGNIPFESVSSARAVRPLVTSHPIVNDLSLENVTIRAPLALSPTPQSEIIHPLLLTDSRPIAFLRESDALQLWVGFNPFLSPEKTPSTLWGIHPDSYPEFVQFWQNVLFQFQPLDIRHYGDTVYWKTGESLLPTRKNKRSEEISTRPDTTRIGMRELNRGNRSWPIPVNLNSPSETNTLVQNTNKRTPLVLQDPDPSQESVKRTKTINVIVLFLFLFTVILISLLHRSPAKP